MKCKIIESPEQEAKREQCRKEVDRIIRETPRQISMEMYARRVAFEAYATGWNLKAKEIESVTPKPCVWIPVSERLPDDDGYFLATVGSFGIDPSETTCHELNWFKGKWYLTSDEMIEMGPVIAWMEKPEPYQEVKDGQD